MGLNVPSFPEDSSEVPDYIPKPPKDIGPGLSLPCDDHTNSRHRPYYHLENDGDGYFTISKVCEKHGDIVSTTVEVDALRYIEISWLELSIEGMVGH